MTFISIVVSLLVERFLGHLQDLRRHDAFLDFAAWLRERGGAALGQGAAGALVTVALPVLAAGLLQGWLHESIFGVLGLAYSILVLLYCLGPRDLAADVEAYRDTVGSADAEVAARAAARITDVDPGAGGGDTHRAVLHGILVQASRRLFGVLFWFALLGPMGAVLYRASAVLSRHLGAETSDYAAMSHRLHALLAWLPARLLAFSYALAGHFEEAVSTWREGAPARAEADMSATERLLVDVGTGALGLEADAPISDDDAAVTAALAMGLVWRALVIWVVVIALLTLAHWAS